MGANASAWAVVEEFPPPQFWWQSGPNMPHPGVKWCQKASQPRPKDDHMMSPHGSASCNLAWNHGPGYQNARQCVVRRQKMKISWSTAWHFQSPGMSFLMRGLLQFHGRFHEHFWEKPRNGWQKKIGQKPLRAQITGDSGGRHSGWSVIWDCRRRRTRAWRHSCIMKVALPPDATILLDCGCCGVWWIVDFWIWARPPFPGIWILGFLVFWLPVFLVFRFFGFLCFWFSGFLVFWFFGF